MAFTRARARDAGGSNTSDSGFRGVCSSTRARRIASYCEVSLEQALALLQVGERGMPELLCSRTSVVLLQVFNDLVPYLVRGGRELKFLIETKAAVVLNTLPQLQVVAQL